LVSFEGKGRWKVNKYFTLPIILMCTSRPRNELVSISIFVCFVFTAGKIEKKGTYKDFCRKKSKTGIDACKFTCTAGWYTTNTVCVCVGKKIKTR